MTHESAPQLVDRLRSFNCRVRIKEEDREPYDWDWPLFAPAGSYLETGKSGPIALDRIEWLDIEKKEKKRLGRLLPPSVIDHQSAIEDSLREIGVSFEVRDDVIRIKKNGLTRRQSQRRDLSRFLQSQESRQAASWLIFDVGQNYEFVIYG